jgi:hypothetical protein
LLQLPNFPRRINNSKVFALFSTKFPCSSSISVKQQQASASKQPPDTMMLLFCFHQMIMSRYSHFKLMSSMCEQTNNKNLSLKIELHWFVDEFQSTCFTILKLLASRLHGPTNAKPIETRVYPLFVYRSNPVHAPENTKS